MIQFFLITSSVETSFEISGVSDLSKEEPVTGNEGDICTNIYAPVCGELIGVNGVGSKETYGNKCFAKELGVKVLYAGKCEEAVTGL